jgi:hypothetical protein
MRVVFEDLELDATDIQAFVPCEMKRRQLGQASFLNFSVCEKKPPPSRAEVIGFRGSTANPVRR